MKNKNITVINVNYNSESGSINLIEMLKKQKGIKLNIIIVDNRSPDDSGLRLDEKYRLDEDVKVILSDANLGFAAGNNLALKYLESINYDGFVAICNNDITYESIEQLSKLMNLFESSYPIGLLSPLMKCNGCVVEHFAVSDRTIIQDIILLTPLKYFFKIKKYEYSKDDPKMLEVDSVPGAFFVGHFNVLKEVNYFDESTFLYGEERIIGRKVRDAGYKNYVYTESYFEHYTSTIISKEILSSKKRELILEGRVQYHKLFTKKRLLIRLLKVTTAINLKINKWLFK